MSKDQTLSGGYRNDGLRDERDVPSDRVHSADNGESPSAATAEDSYGPNEMSKRGHASLIAPITSVPAPAGATNSGRSALKAERRSASRSDSGCRIMAQTGVHDDFLEKIGRCGDSRA
nr:hypothetical protein RKHAN_00522 [Rhizobium sp. Khangiran2]